MLDDGRFRMNQNAQCATRKDKNKNFTGHQGLIVLAMSDLRVGLGLLQDMRKFGISSINQVALYDIFLAVKGNMQDSDP